MANDPAVFSSSPFTQLGEDFLSWQAPTLSVDPELLHWNTGLADKLQLQTAESYIPLLSGNIENSQNFAMLYSGHQFGQYVSQLGDGRALMIGHKNGYDLQLKGAGSTPYSRFADGRAVLRSSIREYLASEALHHLGISTTRALSLIATGETVYRETPERGAVVCRAAESFVRFGSFEVFYYRQQPERSKQLADFVIKHHYPELTAADNPYLALLETVIDNSSKLVALWQAYGFAHGVLNTDNMSILGLTLDYGPYGFMDYYQAGYICNHSDHAGRYAFDQQPAVVGWNLTRLAQALIPLFHEEQEPAVEMANAALQRYPEKFNHYHEPLCRKKLGLTGNNPADIGLFHQLLQSMEANNADFTNTFRSLCSVELNNPKHDNGFIDQFVNRDDAKDWLDDYRQRLAEEKTDEAQRHSVMRKTNPKYILRNHLLHTAIQQAEAGDYSEIERLYSIMQKPYDEQPEFERYAKNAPAWSKELEISCSS